MKSCIAMKRYKLSKSLNMAKILKCNIEQKKASSIITHTMGYIPTKFENLQKQFLYSVWICTYIIKL